MNGIKKMKKWRMLPKSWSLVPIMATILLTATHTSSHEQIHFQEPSHTQDKRGLFHDVVDKVSNAVHDVGKVVGNTIDYVENTIEQAACDIGVVNNCNPPPNKPPKISCPTDQIVWAPTGQSKATVKWSVPTASDPDGNTPGVIQISSLNSGSNFDEGEYTVTYQATDSDSATVQCSFTITVKVHRCIAEFGNLDNGQPTCSLAQDKGKFVWGTVCDYSCNKGYELQGPTKVTCDESEKWLDGSDRIINEAPTCLAVQCGQVPTIPDGQAACKSSVYQSSCPISCDPGYVVTGSNKTICQYNKQWSSPGACKDVEAPSLQCAHEIEMFAGPKLASVSVTWSMPTATDNSGEIPKVTSDVQSGSLFAPGATVVKFTASDANQNLATCEMTVNIKVKRCPKLVKVNNSDVVCTHDNTYGSDCTTTCHSGYELSGDGIQICQENQTWSGLQPSCSPIHCGPVPAIKNGSTVCNNTTYMSVCQITCGQGYQIDGSDNTTCQADKQWTSPGKCKDIQAPDLQCGPDIHAYAGPKLAPTKITWTMPQSTDNSGVPPNVASDIKTGSLFPPGLTTVKFMSTDDANNIAACNITVNVSVLQCPALQIAEHANMSCSHGTAYGSDCDTTCDLGYDLKGDKIQTCQANHTWNGQPPHCERMECSEPMFDTTGLMQFNCTYGHFLGENCYVSCSDGNPPGGTREITCTSKDYGTTGHVMYWTFAGSSPPYCAVGLCPELTPPKDGSLACKYVNGSGEFCVSSCNEKTMRPPTMPDVYECMERNTMWVPTDYVADCFGPRRLGLPVTEPEFHYFSNSCDPNSQEIKEDFLKAMSASIACALGCNVTEIHVICNSNSSGRRDVSAKTVASYLVVISPRIVLDAPANQDWSADDLKKLYNNITATFNAKLQKASAAGDFKIPSIGTFDKFTPGQLEVTCPHGTILDQRELTCPGCGEGYIYDNTTQTCVPCPVGTYQDQEIAFQCLQCPDGKTTTGSRSQSFKECQYLCIPGTFSKSGFEPCDGCQRGTYQSKSGMTSCDLCPFGMSTETGASTNATKCQFFNKEMTNTTQGPWIQHFNVTMETFSVVTWLQPISNWPRMTLTFDLDKRFVPTGSAYLSLGMLKIFLIPRTSKEERPWYHLAVVYDNGKASLYVDGDLKAVAGGLSFTHMWRETISFVNSDHVDSVVLSGLEMTRKVLTKEDILFLSTSCEKHILHENILAVDKLDKTLVTSSSCHQGTCTKLPAPKHGSLECEYVPLHGEFCRPRCEANTVRPSTMPDVYKCLDRTSTWEPMDYVQNCVAERHPQAAVMKQSFHYLNDNCDFNSQKLKKDFLKMLNTSLYNFTCGSTGCYDAQVVNVTCSTSSTGAQPQSTYSRISAPYSIEVSLELSLSPFNDQGTPSDTDRYYKDVAASITSLINDNSDNVSFTLSLAEVPSALLEYRCEAGTLLDEELLRCAGCGEGYMYDNKTDTCIACPIGTYQDKEIAFECVQCPDLKATSSVRAKTWLQCQYFCSPGTSSQSGIEPCEPCPRGSYQSKSGMTSCDLCPYGMSTVAEASISDSACQFFNKEMTNSTLGPSIQLFDLTPEKFSFVTWIQDTFALPRMTLNFDLYEPAMSNGSAYLSVGTFKVFIQPEEDLTSQEIRHWYHMAVVYNNGEAALYVDGSQVAKMGNLSFSQMWRETISFVSSDDLNSVTLSGLQMTTSALTADKVSSLAYSCDGHVDRNILLTDRLDVTLVTPSSCDEKQCGAPPPVQNGRIDCNSTTYQSMCTLTCGQGYQVFGNDSITCQNDKLWTHPGMCKDVEPPKFQCGQDIHTTAGPKLAPAIVTWTMPIATDNTGSIPNMTSDPQPGSLFAPGVTTVNFTASDDDNNVARCSIIVNVTVNTCPPVPTPNNANISCTHGNAYGSDCLTTCDPGYELKGDRTQTCEGNLMWSGKGSCERMSCQVPLFDLSSMMIYECNNGYYLGESCTIHCQDGNPPGGSQVINCARDASAPPGHDMQWNFIGNAAPYCHAGGCTKLAVPKDGSLACDYINGTGEVCVPSCNANVMRPPSMHDVYMCLDRTFFWDPNDYVPDCFGRRRPGLPVIEPDFYYYINVCDPNSDEIKQNFLKALNQSLVCSGGCNDISTITVTCYANNAGKRDAASASAYLVVISPEINLGAMVDQGDTTDTKKYHDQLSMQMNTDLQTESDNGLFNVPKIGVYDGYGAGLAQYRCEAGMVLDLKSLYCAGCGEGHYYDSTTTTCIACPVGTYQDQEVAFQCTQCPDNKTTKTTRAKSVQECQNFCHPGTLSQSGFEPCDPCPRGSYQSEFSKTSCDYCPYGMSTLASGSKTKSDCQFFDIVMTNETTGPWIQMFDKTPQTFSIVTWVHVTSGSQRTTLTFAMDQTQARSDSAYLALGDTKIYVSAREDYISRIIRKWYHLALVYDHGEVQLYIDREIMTTIKNVSFSDLWKKTFSFVSSKGLQSVVLSHLEMTRSVLTLDDITPMFVSCDLTVDQNILVTNKVDDTLVTPSTCDDINDCSSDPCGEHGTCLDGRAGYTCLCEAGWGGTTCREPLSGE